MSKAILIMNMPESCYHCQSRYAFGECGVLHRHIEEGVKKPDWCPLHELPDAKESIPYQSGDWRTIINNIEIKGYNDCLNEILSNK